MKRTLAFWAAVSLCLIASVGTALAQYQPPPQPSPSQPAPSDIDTLTSGGEKKETPAEKPAADTTAVSAGARARRVSAAGKKMSTVFSLGLGSAINYQPDSFSNQYDPSFGMMLSGGVRRAGVTLCATFDYNFFFASGTTPDDLNVLLLMADIKYNPVNSTARPYILACAGLYRTWIVNTNYREVVIGYGAGAGIEVEIDKTRRLFLEGRYILGQTRDFENTHGADFHSNTEVIPFRFGVTWEIQ